MAGFIGGSAYAMSREISEGYHLVNERSFKSMSRGDLDKLAFELERHLREVRGNQPRLDDLQAIQQRNRRISRLNSALIMLRAYRQRTAGRGLAPPPPGGRSRTGTR